MAKKFNRKFMHSSRRKLAEMVFTGEYEKDAQVGWTAEQKEREIGDIWEDEYHKYEKKDGYILKTSKNSDAFQEIRDFIKEKNECKNPDCKSVKLSAVDKKLIKRTGYCITCLTDNEHQIRTSGLWSEYENYKIWTRMVVDGKLRLDQLKQAHDELKQVHEYINEDGTIEKWIMPDPVEDVKAEMMEMIKSGEKEVADLDEKRMKAFEKLKKAGLEYLI